MLSFEQAILLAVTIHAHSRWRVQAIAYVGAGQYEVLASPISSPRTAITIETQDAWEQARTQEEERYREPVISRGRPRRRREEGS